MLNDIILIFDQCREINKRKKKTIKLIWTLKRITLTPSKPIRNSKMKEKKFGKLIWTLKGAILIS